MMTRKRHGTKVPIRPQRMFLLLVFIISFMCHRFPTCAATKSSKSSSISSIASNDAENEMGKKNRVSLSASSKNKNKKNNKTKNAKQKLNKIIQKGNTAASAANLLSKSSSSSLALQQQQHQSPVSVKAILTPRTWSIRTMIRMVCFVSFVLTLLKCFQTAGVPHIRMIWDLVYGDDSASYYNNKRDDSHHPQGMTTTTTTTPAMESKNTKTTMPLDYLPSTGDLLLARMIAKSTKEMLPPISLPSAWPLLGVLVSIAMYIAGTILLPRWFLPIRVFMDYTTTTAESTIVTAYNNANHPKTKVLVRIHDPIIQQQLAISSSNMMEGGGGTGKQKRSQSAIICDLLSSPQQTVTTTSRKKSSTTTTNTANATKSKSSKQKHQEEEEYNEEENSVDMQYTHPYPHYFELNQCRFYYDIKTGTCVNGGPTLLGAPLKDIQSFVHNGGLARISPSTESSAISNTTTTATTTTNDQRRKIAEERFKPYNRPKLSTPTIQEAFYARISSPLVVVQLLGRLLSILEQGKEALFQTLMTISRHYWDARRAILSARQMGEDVQASARDISNLQVHILKSVTDDQSEKQQEGKEKKKNKSNAKKPLRQKQVWVTTTADELVPGDIFVISSQQQQKRKETDLRQNEHINKELIIPVDALVLDGQGLANEAILTGESVPQSKRPLDFQEEMQQDDLACLNMDEHRTATLFAGTTLVHCASDTSAIDSTYNLPPHNVPGGLTCLALRTGTYSSKGELLRALKSSANVGAFSNDQTDRDALRLIGSLSAFATISCISLFLPRADGKKPVPAFRRAIQCARIAMASIPSDLPFALSSVAQSCSKMLRHQSDVVCSEPGALLTAAFVDTVVFDKTGTLTADTQSLSKLVSKTTPSILETSPKFQRFILAGCHSLVHMEEGDTENGNKKNTATKIVGDPLDLSSLRFSAWKFNHTTKSYVLPESINGTIAPSDPIQLWQIKSFPFDPKKRLSSAVVLAKSADGAYRLWVLTKGSPETMARLYTSDHSDFIHQFNNHTQALEAEGFRCIALGAAEISEESSITKTLFPNGLHGNEENLEYARAHGATLHRSEFEHLRSTNIAGLSKGLEFHGHACFNARVRPSSKRVINELQQGGIHPVMLTGDAIDAALAVASKVGLTKERKVAILETYEENSQVLLRWRIVALKDGKASVPPLRILEVNKTSVSDFIKRQEQGKYALAATGDALEIILDARNSDKLIASLADNLFRFSVLARATPALKTSAIMCLKNRCEKTVMMCGDGVNDVSAMKAADVAVALLNGFGAEGHNELEQDLDDKRRKEKIMRKNIGSNRQKSRQHVASLRREERARVNAKIEEAHAEIRRKAAARRGEEYDPDNVVLEIEDAKAILSATMAVVREESKRKQNLKRGGGDAARILAEERRQSTSAGDDGDDAYEEDTIKPGEASLVASFSCLHPSIDGVDAVLRSGIATAGCALATQKSIALHSLMACYNLASLYRDGFRYGKRMWPIELTMYTLLYEAEYRAACTPRPRLPRSMSLRPCVSMFEPSSLFSTVGQAVVHLVTMAFGVEYARRLERVDMLKAAPTIRVKEGQYPPKLEKLLGALAEGVILDKEGQPSLFRRPPFQPNYETNIVFILSILQSAISMMINHQGKPFYRSLLEQRVLCDYFGITLIFIVGCVTEFYSTFNNYLEMRLLPNAKSKIVFLGIVAVDILGCIVCRVVSDLPLQIALAELPTPSSTVKGSKETAADLEEKLLYEEEYQNLQRNLVGCCILLYATFRGLLRGAVQS